MCYDPSSGGFRYVPPPGEVAFPRTGAAIVSLMMCGRHQDDEVKGGLKYLNNQPDDIYKRNDLDPYPSYYGALSHYLAGDEEFKKWYPRVRNALLAAQQANGRWGNGGINTPWALIVLGLPYSFVPAYQR